jgi:hypothetical protein
MVPQKSAPSFGPTTKAGEIREVATKAAWDEMEEKEEDVRPQPHY